MTEKLKNIAEKASSAYLDRTKTRAAVQAIPYIGGALDTLFAGKGNKIQNERLEHFLGELHERLGKLEEEPKIDEETLFDFALETIEKAVKTKSNEKRQLYANIMANQVADPTATEYAEMALRIVSELDAIHFRILSIGLSAPKCSSPFDGIQMMTITPYTPSGEPEEGAEVILPTALSEELNEYPVEAIRYAASELISKGLLRDEGIGRWDATAMEYFCVTDTATWINSLLTT